LAGLGSFQRQLNEKRANFRFMHRPVHKIPKKCIYSGLIFSLL